MKTSPVNHSLGPAVVSIEFLVICITSSASGGMKTRRAHTNSAGVEPRTHLTRRQLERRGSRLWGESGIDNTCRVAAVLRTVGGVDLVVQVVRLDEENVLVNATSLNMRLMAVQSVAEPGGRAPIDGPNIEAVTNADNPDRHWPPQRPVAPDGGNLQFVPCPILLSSPLVHPAIALPPWSYR